MLRLRRTINNNCMVKQHPVGSQTIIIDVDSCCGLLRLISVTSKLLNQLHLKQKLKFVFVHCCSIHALHYNLPRLIPNNQCLFLLFGTILFLSYMAYTAPAKHPPAPIILQDMQSTFAAMLRGCGLWLCMKSKAKLHACIFCT